MKKLTEVHGVELITDGDMVVYFCSTHPGEEFEPVSVGVWKLACAFEDGIAIDVGAYTGLYTILAIRAGKEVAAYEPNPSSHARLRQNVRRHRGSDAPATSLHLKAVGATSGTGRLVRSAPLSSAARVVKGAGVTVTTLDEEHAGRRVAVIKMDAEGAEPEIIRGARRVIEESRPVIIVEANTEEAHVALDEALGRLGYPPGERADERNLIYRSKR